MTDSKRHSTQELAAIVRMNIQRWNPAKRKVDQSAAAHADAALDALLEQLEVADTFARVADAYCWDPETTTHADLMNARAAWQSAVGRMRLRALDSNPASREP